MNHKSSFCFRMAIGLGAFWLAASFSAAEEAPPRPPDIVFIAVDDMNDWIGPLGGHPQAITPNLDRLAASGMTFTNAHTPASACHPARVAIMTGLRPSSTGITENVFHRQPSPSWRAEHPRLKEAVTLSQHFRDHGYRAVGAGKIYHSLQWGPFDENDPATWDLYMEGGPQGGPIPHQIRPPVEVYNPPQFFGRRHRHFTWGPIEAADEEMSDAVVADWVIARLNEPREKPLFLAAGIFRPHMPWEVPAKYFDLYPLDEIQLPSYREDDLLNKWDHGRRHWHQFVMQNNQWPQVVQSYLASITFADAQIGRIIDAIDQGPNKDNTIIVLWSDHGMHIGEKDNWEKFTVWERSTRVPLLWRVPGVTEPGSRSGRAVSLLDIFPTLAELAGLPAPAGDQLEGESLRPLLRAPQAGERTQPAVTSYRNFHGLRSDHFRYIWYPSGLEELYDHRDDPHEYDNLAYLPGHRATLEQHRALLRAYTGAPVPEGDPAVPPAFDLLPDGRIRRKAFVPRSELVRRARAEHGREDLTPGASAAERPNIILIMADDLGFSDIGCYGGEIETPVLDRLAAGGLRYKQFYNAARCCPTRAALMTGLYPHQAGIGHMIDAYAARRRADFNSPHYSDHLSPHTPTLAEVLRPAGYHTLMTGKWHLGNRPGEWPVARGFDRSFVMVTGALNFYGYGPQNLAPQGVRQHLPLAIDDQPYTPPMEGFFTTDDFTRHAIRFLRERPEDAPPFLLYIAHNAPHWPLHARPETIAKYRGRYRELGWDAAREQRMARLVEMGFIEADTPLAPRPGGLKPWTGLSPEARDRWDEWMAVYAAQVEEMDTAIGWLMDALRETGQEENTLVLFFSDNGGAAERPVKTIGDAPLGSRDSYEGYAIDGAHVSSAPFRKTKKFTHEGGIASPLIAYWPAGIPAERRGGLVADPLHVIDLMATCIDLGRAPFPAEWNGRATLPPEGVSLAPTLRGEPIARPQPLFWEHEGHRGVRDGDWKLVASHNGPWELYHLGEDRTEMNNRAAEQPARVADMAALYTAWAERVGVLPWR